ncbi:MAG: acetyl esterase [Granulosicoccus sp.]|jgi:acetyl esterase
MSATTPSSSKYENLLDEEVWAFIRKTNSFFPADATALSIDEQRALYNEMCNAFKKQPEQAVQRSDYLISKRDVPVREYRTVSGNNNLPVVVYYHGGGFVVGNLDSHDDVCATICAFTQFNVISCEYKLSPEFKHPEAFDDAYAVFQGVAMNTTQPVLVIGDSAGATLAASVSGKARHCEKQVAAQILIYPYLGGPTESGSCVEHAEAPMLSTSDVKYYDQMRIDLNKPHPDDETFAPLWTTDFSKLPPTAIFSAQCDPLCDDGVIYAQNIRLAGGQAHCTIEPGLVHGYLRARHSTARAKESFERILLAIQSLSNSQ